MSEDDATTGQPEEDAVIDPGTLDTDGAVDPVAVGPGDIDDIESDLDDPAGAAVAAAGTGHNGGSAADALPVGWAGMTTPGDASLLDLVDRLTAVLERSDLAELEVAAGGTTIILRSPTAVAPMVVAPPVALAGQGHAPDAGPSDGASAGQAQAAAAAPERPSVKAPLTGIYYNAPSPGAQPYVSVGNHVSAGQIIGLIEAMKLFNEIKSDLSGRVVRICAESGALVKAKQPLIEVEPA
jgi:acetyl-CoA carboxylase biotin carboxyl carrier protein